MVKITQLRYYGENHVDNYPFAQGANFISNYSFSAYKPIHQLGIQTLPGTKIYLNQSHYPIIIGSTGIFEINCDNTSAVLNSFRIAEDSINKIKDNKTGYLIIDIVYGEEGEE